MFHLRGDLMGAQCMVMCVRVCCSDSAANMKWDELKTGTEINRLSPLGYWPFSGDCVCVCVCVWEREKVRHTDREGGEERERERERERDRQRAPSSGWGWIIQQHHFPPLLATSSQILRSCLEPKGQFSNWVSGPHLLGHIKSNQIT